MLGTAPTIEQGETTALGRGGAAALDPAPGLTGQALTIVATVKTGRVDALNALLTSIGEDVKGHPHLPADDLELVHFFRWVILRKGTEADADYLVFESNYDGTVEQHLDELLRVGAKAVHRIYSECNGYPFEEAEPLPGSYPQIRKYLEERALKKPYAAFYRANPNKSARRIKLEAKVRDVIEAYFDKERGALVAESPTEIHRRVKAHVAARGLLSPLKDGFVPPPEPNAVATAFHVLLVVIPVLILSPIVIPALLYKEARDRQWSPADGGHVEPVPALKDLEDRVVQNQLSHVVPVKPGFVRSFLLKHVFSAIDALARYQFVQGRLGTIASIHFARWIFLDEGRRLMFFSNYDGSWESYLGDFIDLAAIGLTSVWSNTEGFPRATFLAFKGATDEERFKGWTRAHQVTTPFWYSAYPTLSVKNTLANGRIAEGLVNTKGGAGAIRQWLALI